MMKEPATDLSLVSNAFAKDSDMEPPTDWLTELISKEYPHLQRRTGAGGADVGAVDAVDDEAAATPQFLIRVLQNLDLNHVQAILEQLKHSTLSKTQILECVYAIPVSVRFTKPIVRNVHTARGIPNCVAALKLIVLHHYNYPGEAASLISEVSGV